MKKNIIFIIYILVIYSSCAQDQKSNQKIILTGIAPIASIISAIGGELFDVEYMIPYTVNPHTFALKPSDVMKREKATMIIALDNHIDGNLLKTDNAAQSYYLLNDTGNAHDHDHDHDHHHHDHEQNSHLWLSYIHTADLANKIVHILSEKFPESTSLFVANHEQFTNKLHMSFEFVKSELQNNSQKRYVVQRHHAWDYLLEELDIVLLDTLEEIEGVQVSLKKVTGTLTLISQLPESSRLWLIDDAFSTASSPFSIFNQETSYEITIFNPMVTPDGENDAISILEYYSLVFR